MRINDFKSWLVESESTDWAELMGLGLLEPIDIAHLIVKRLSEELKAEGLPAELEINDRVLVLDYDPETNSALHVMIREDERITFLLVDIQHKFKADETFMVVQRLETWPELLVESPQRVAHDLKLEIVSWYEHKRRQLLG